MEPTSDDTMLIQRAVAGDARAFAQLVTKYYDVIFRIAFKWCRNRADAEDIAQDSCLRLARGIKSYKGDAAFVSWLYRLVINAAIDWQRRQGKQIHEGHEDLSGQAADAEAALYARQVLARIDRLPHKEKTALLLVMAEGMSHAEAAIVMEVKESTVSWYIHEARKTLSAWDGKEKAHG